MISPTTDTQTRYQYSYSSQQGSSDQIPQNISSILSESQSSSCSCQHQKEFYALFDELLQTQSAACSNNDDNRQGIMTFIPAESQRFHFEENNPRGFDLFIKQLEKQDFSSLFVAWNHQTINKIKFITNHWKSYAPDYKDAYQKFLNLSEKNYNCELLGSIYRGLDRIIPAIQKKIDKQCKNNVMGESLQNPNNFFFMKYLNELVLKANKEGSLFLIGPNQTKKALGQHIGENNLFAENKHIWQMIFFVAFCRFRCNKEGTRFDDIKEQIDSIYKFAELSIKGNELTQPCDRLCCARFFYLNFDICPVENVNILFRKKLDRLKAYLPAAKKDKAKDNDSKKKQMVEKPQQSEKDMQKNELDETMLDVCALLNSGGGVVLFNTEPEYLELRPYGESLIKSEMDGYKLLLADKLKIITPKVTHGSQIIISFVPLAKHPYQYGFIEEVHSDDDRKANRIYIDGLYVLRIAVMPARTEQLYCYTASDGKTKSAIFENAKRRDLLAEQMVCQLKRKFQFYQIEDADQQLAQLLAKDFTHVDKGHRCVQPYLGKLVHTRQQPKIYDNPERNFKFMSLMVASNNSCNEIIKKMLISKGIQNQIYTGFQKYKLKAAMNSVPIFHNCRFDQLLTEVAYRPEFKFGERPTLVIKVTEFLKFVNRKGEDFLNRNDFDTLQKWLEKEFPEEYLQYWTFTDDDNITEHYLRSGSRLSLVFIYYVMYQFNEKSMFKDPKSTRSLSDEEKRQKMKLIYSSKKSEAQKASKFQLI